MRHWVVVWCCGEWCVQGNSWAEAPKAHVVDEIVSRMMAKNEAQQADLLGYSSERTYRVEYRGLTSAVFTVCRRIPIALE